VAKSANSTLLTKQWTTKLEHTLSSHKRCHCLFVFIFSLHKSTIAHLSNTGKLYKLYKFYSAVKNTVHNSVTCKSNYW